MFNRLLHAVAVGFFAALACLLLALLLPAIKVDVIAAIGHFLGDWAWPIGIVVGILDYASGGIGPRFPVG